MRLINHGIRIRRIAMEHDFLFIRILTRCFFFLPDFFRRFEYRKTLTFKRPTVSTYKTKIKTNLFLRDESTLSPVLFDLLRRRSKVKR